ncbi:MAG: DinB family protein [Vicinamibacterales bacterium]
MPTRPASDEYAPYYEKYVSLVAGDDIVPTLTAQLVQTLKALAAIPTDRGTHRYAPGKWSINEVVGHMIDTERVFGYRAMRFARNDATPLSGFDQDTYIANARFDACSLADLREEFACVRRSHLYLLRQLDPAAWSRRGVANGVEVTVRGLAYIIAGHELHHMQILATRY